MRSLWKPCLFLAFIPFLLASGLAKPTAAEEHCYGVEVNGVLCGYVDVRISTIEVGGRELVLMKQDIFTMLSALGMAFNSEMAFTYHVDPETGRFTYHDSYIHQGDTELDLKVLVEGNRVRITSSLMAEEEVVEIESGVVLHNTQYFPHLIHDFVEAGATEKTYRIFEVRAAEVQDVTYTKVGLEMIELVGREREALVLDELHRSTGVKARTWLDASSGHILKTQYPDGRVSYLADPAIKKRIELANLDETIATKTNVSIADVTAIIYLKVRAVIDPTGLWVTTEDLNVPGQRFVGTVEENHIEGVFEIRHPRYDGEGAPAYPTDRSAYESLEKYLDPQEAIESDDPVLMAKARELAEGSRNSWEAATRIAKWVAGNIDYAIPGGVMARKTYDLRAGECGAHSLLTAALCRGVGIPARVVWGCMYIPSFGGAFGQHAWNEIYMGKAGWIPLDSTANETDFCDSGHIRIGELPFGAITVNTREMEILDHELAHGVVGTGARGVNYEEKLGKFSGPQGNVAEVLLQNGSLAIALPGGQTLAFADPDEEGRWVCKMAPRLHCVFEHDARGAVDAVVLHQLVQMRRRSDPEKIDESVPAELRPLLGGYYLAQARAEFMVIIHDGKLAIEDPLAKSIIHLQDPDEDGRRLDEFDKNTIWFESNEEGKVETMVLDSANRFTRI